MTGVLALQGSFALHLATLRRLGASAQPIKNRAELDAVSRLVIPGGESTVIAQLLTETGLFNPIRERALAGDLAILGTCAGAILLGRAPEGADALPAPTEPGAQRPPREPPRLAVARTVVARNAYGRQIDSFRAQLPGEGALAGGPPLEAVFIRAPRFTNVPADAEVLARRADEPVLIREGRLVLSAFHPELSGQGRVHALLLEV